MMNPKYRRYSILTIRIILGLLFLISGVGKLINGADARYLVELLATEYFWLIEYASAIVTGTSILELVLAVFLLWGKYLKWALSVTLLMLIGFSSVLGYFYLQGMNVDSCGCFGAFGFASGLEFTLIRNAVLITMILGAYLLMSSNDNSWQK
ncbi:MauE/DoxX family redox-associated membrane protein [Fodinibius halophilus]|uniref:Methylamine utilisation protein MauE domain-containing protein n=1 Tax=Fodinibius halophilus TaxID=1736908 RepID=A0A6M1TB24_9BACT|nr:MauE/DoxX family redox-associated membrane protein [Fodinibius halophilus]NGP89623.1 hypothetical protein [Fodinibius halophilus]